MNNTIHYTYDPEAEKYFEYTYLDSSVVEALKLKGRIFITDPYIISQINNIEKEIRHCIVVNGNHVSISEKKLQNFITMLFKNKREEWLKYYDAQYFILTEKIQMETNEVYKNYSIEKLNEVFRKKQTLRDISDHPLIKAVIDFKTYKHALDEIHKDLAPDYLTNYAIDIDGKSIEVNNLEMASGVMYRP